MNLEEREALLARIKEAVGDHCHGYIFVSEVDHDNPMQEGQCETMMLSSWEGGMTLATGLTRRFSRHLEMLEQDIYDEGKEQGLL